MKLLKKSLPLHPLLFAVYPILFLYAQNVDLTTVGQVFPPMAVAAGVALLLFVVLYALLRDGAKAGLLVSLVALLFFSYGHFVDLFEGLEGPIGGLIQEPNTFALPLWALFAALGVYFLLRTRRDLHTLTDLLNVVAAVLVLFSLAGIASYHLGKVGWTGSAGQESTETSSDYVGSAEGQPDIYYIILDAYTSQDVLEETWNFDNSEFLDYLTDKGFHVIPHAHTNYPHTFLSLASSLNMQYVNFLSETLGTDATDRSIPNQMIQDSEVVRFLKSRGYKFVHFQTGWGPTAENPHADRDIRCGNVNEFIEVLLRTTILRPVVDDLISHDRREVILCTFATLAEVQHMVEGPRFVFAHVLVPHPPFLFGPHGEAINTDPALQARDWVKYYLGQLQFVNEKTEELVDRILAEAETPPVIILQGDHGSKSIRESADTRAQMLHERLGILNAYYLPGDGDQYLYDSITPVNTFRVIFNAYFDTDYELLEDRSYFCRIKRPYEFIDATDTLAQQ